MSGVKQRVPQIILTVVALLLIASAFVARPEGGSAPLGPRLLAIADQEFATWFSILAVFAFLMGGLNLVATHLAKIRERGPDRFYSLVTLVSFLVVLVVGTAKLGGPPGLQGDVTAPGSWLSAIFDAVLSPLHATLYSLLAFYIASASYRAFRARSLESSLLLGSALVVLLGRIPAGRHLTAWIPEPLAFLRVEELSLWILRVPNTAGQRALMIGIALGVIALAVRMIAGVEKDPRSGGDGS